MKKLLYLMHVPWRWAKQRPHFIAEQLARYFDVHIPFEKQYLFPRGRFVRNETARNLKLVQLFKLPHVEVPVIEKINSFLVQYQLRKIIDDFHFVWLTHPAAFERIRGMLPSHCRVIYDCMDDVLEFPYMKTHPDYRKRMERLEEELVERSNLIFASSNHLRLILEDRYGRENKIFVVNNALSLNYSDEGAETLPLSAEIERCFSGPGKKISYIGTISQWIDTDLMLASLAKFPEITYLLFGPCEIRLPSHKRLVKAGPVEHKYVSDIMKRSDALVMPFKINKLVLSVDPVKLYEYISSGTPSVAVDYGETRKFGDFIYLYRDGHEYLSLIDRLIEGRLDLKGTYADHETFARENTWENRVEYMSGLMVGGRG